MSSPSRRTCPCRCRPCLCRADAFAFLPRRLLTPRFGAGLARFLRSTSWPCPRAFSLRALCRVFSYDWVSGASVELFDVPAVADLYLSLLLLALVLGGCLCLGSAFFWSFDQVQGNFSGGSGHVAVASRFSTMHTPGQSGTVKKRLQAGCLAPLPC